MKPIAYLSKHYSPALVTAVRQVITLIEQKGWEYPDASAKVAMKTGFMVEEITRAYDALHEG